MIFAVMMIASVNVNARGNSRYHKGRHAQYEMTSGRHYGGHVSRTYAAVPSHYRGGYTVVAGGPRIDHRGFVHGWDGRVRYLNGRWGYLRGSDWYWYDTYFEPAYYFAHRPHYFRAHYIPVDGRVVAGVAGAVAVGTLISALCH